MKKYTIIISHTSKDMYAVVLKSFELNEDGNEVNVHSYSKSNKTLQECLTIQKDFIDGNI
jgi:hypothetical protein